MKSKVRYFFRWLIIVILLLVIAVSGFKIIQILTTYHEIEASNEEAREEFISSYKEDTGLPEIDFAALKAANSEIVGWIYIPDTNVNYPVVQSKTSDYYYLTIDYKHRWSVSGSIFMSMVCSPDFSDIETLIYGHNMHNGEMFGKLKKYTDPKYLEAHQDLYILLPDGGTIKYKVTEARYVSIEDDVYMVPKTGGEPETLVLSTCTDDSSDTERLIVVAEYEGRI